MINVFLRFNNYKVKHMSSDKWTVPGKSGPGPNKTIFSTKNLVYQSEPL